MTRRSAGLLLFRKAAGVLEVFLVHPGGPYWARKDTGAWSIPKGEFSDGEDPLHAARREFEEETGMSAAGEFVPLQPVRQPSGKVIHAWALRADVDPARVRSNVFSIEWPPRSGQRRDFPEVDRAAWFPLDEAASKIQKGQAPFLEQLHKQLSTE